VDASFEIWPGFALVSVVISWNESPFPVIEVRSAMVLDMPFKFTFLDQCQLLPWGDFEMPKDLQCNFKSSSPFQLIQIP